MTCNQCCREIHSPAAILRGMYFHVLETPDGKTAERGDSCLDLFLQGNLPLEQYLRWMKVGHA